MDNRPDERDDAKSKIKVLAEKNSPLLIKTFKLSAPLFCSKLVLRQPKLVRTELIFCIYLKLNYSTKEIAKFLNVSPKAIQNRKNRLRKKLNIDSSLDLYQWFDSL
ncbi:LuxR C-terminal-related transcriptional regulator [Chryseobacterium sp.]|uniref:helix-turn-helix transcriptional regulator n=1 Tax=Chryseobacterium sp. TaxID=1871047 RepID=UPI0028963831|nr:LuxR C-terminal-related transcriptional regulator [Chryseobacterium sp.]